MKELLLILTLLTTQEVYSEIYTSMVEMEGLLQTEGLLMQTLEGYIKVLEDKLSFLKKHLSDFVKLHNEASIDIQEYLSNPINAYLITKRLTADWYEVERMMLADVGKDYVDNVKGYKTYQVLKFPTQEDLIGSAKALLRLQDTYNLSTSAVAQGVLNGVQYNSALSSGDCFELGRLSYYNKDYYHTDLWMTEAMEKYDEEQNKSTIKSEILDYLSFSTYMRGNIRRALKLTKDLLEIVPDHSRAVMNKMYFEKEIKELEQNGLTEKKVKTVDDETFKKSYSYYRLKYEKACRGELKPDIKILSKLNCFYLQKTPFTKLARIKVEQAHSEPDVTIFHDVIYDNEIEVVKKLSLPRFQRAAVQSDSTGKPVIAEYRIGKLAWLEDGDHEYIDRLNHRVEDLTGLTTKTGEQFQVVNYGIGGHYEPHFDFAQRGEKDTILSLGTGDRIATILFYMTDVAQGGATAFPDFNVAVSPRKGTAVLWHNLHRNGEKDYRTRHAACPVLTGYKWIINKWLHEVGQEFRRPCNLENDQLSNLPPDVAHHYNITQQ